VLSKAREGKVHDKRQLDEEEIVGHLPDQIPIHLDLGYQGLQNEDDRLMLTATGLWNFYLEAA
jgi:hypothetical protein